MNEIGKAKIGNDKITIRLAAIPDFALNEYHQEQIEYYSKFTELVYRALSIDSVSVFLQELIKNLGINEVEIRIMRLPSFKSKIVGITVKGRILDHQLHGRAWKKKPLIDIFPDCLFLDKFSEPYLNVGLRGYVVNGSIRTVIHELLHKSGLHDEAKVRELTEQLYKEFRTKYIQAFNEEIKPLVKEWKRFEKRLTSPR
ncbi:MAG: hypothetical protein NWE95_05020 [Candidatus Bathyarchaeota archaeon]|nr:hypothetical protein [Candidatus Bathyarchaeota archaeon]